MKWKIRNKYRTYLETGVMTMPDGTATFTRGRNVYVNLAGNICKLPFDAGRDGIWRFDGQFYYLIKEQ
jgi:hypothetical protein